MDPVNETSIRLPNVQTRWGEFDALVVESVKEESAKRRGLVLFSDIFGHDSAPMRQQARHFAQSGFVTIIPDLFKGQPWRIDAPTSSPDFEAWREQQAQPYERIWDIGDTCQAYIASKLGAQGCGIVGYCIGGGRLVEALVRDEDRKHAAGVVFYGTRINPTDIAAIRVPVLFIFAELDALVPAELVREMRRNLELQASAARGRIEVFEGRGHGFAHSGGEADKDDAARALSMCVEWLDQHV